MTATHLLECSHCLGGNRRNFTMRCQVLKTMPDGRLKILVFGRLYWKGTEHEQRVRYVAADRVREATQ